MAQELTVYVENLKLELCMAKKVLEASLVLSAPMSKLPDEVLSHIFENLGSIGHETLSSYNLSQLRYAALVCKRWRDIIVSTPKFWARVTLPSYALSSPQGTLTRLDRAGVLPLTLKITSLSYLTGSALQRLGPSINRVTSVEVELDEQEVVGGKLFTSCHALPNVNHLSLQLHFNPTPAEDPLAYLSSELDGHYQDLDLSESPAIAIGLSNQQYPRLTTVDIHVEYPLYKLVLPWAQLRELKLHTLDVIDFDPIHIMAQLDRVEKLSINFGLGIPPNMSSGNPSAVLLPCLRSLSLWVNVPDDGTLDILRYTRMPSLQDLEINGICTQHQLVESLRNPELRSILSLNLSFMITRVHDEAKQLVETFQEFRLLESFRFNVVNAPYLEEAILRAMGANLGEVMFPCLQSLKIVRTLRRNSEPYSLQNMLRSRVSSVNVPIDARKRLKEVIISCWDDRPESLSATRPVQILRPRCYNDRSTHVQIEGIFLDDDPEKYFVIKNL